MSREEGVVRRLPEVSRPPRMVDLEAEADLRRCGALKEFWYVACLSSELPAGKPLARTIFGTPLVLFRDAAGVPSALFDRCLHRNAPLSGGVVLGGNLACAYHGWTYDRTGTCVHVPSLGPAQAGARLSDADLSEAGLCRLPCDAGRVRSFPVIEQDGLVFVYPGEGAPARRPPFRVPFHGDESWCVYFMVTRFENGVTPLVENFMDVPHTSFVHRGWFRKPEQREVPATVRREDGAVHVTYREKKDALTGLGRLFNPKGLEMTHTDRFFIPNVTRVDYRFGEVGFAICSQCTPAGPTESWVYTAISFRLPWDLPRAAVAKALRPIVEWYTRRVIQQDVEIMELQRRGLVGAPGGGDFRGTEADLLHSDIEAYRGWLREGGQGSGPPDMEREITFWV